MDEHAWLASLDALVLECDGMTRVVTALLQRDGIAHSAKVGRLQVPGVGRIPLHHWIELADGRCLDLRARLWLGNDARVPHGIVPAERGATLYDGCSSHIGVTPVAFWALTDCTIDTFAPAAFLRPQPSEGLVAACALDD